MAKIRKKIVFEGLSNMFMQFKNFNGTTMKNSTTRSVGLSLTDPGCMISYGEFDDNGELIPGGLYITGGDENGVNALMEALTDDGWHISWAKNREGEMVPFISGKIKWVPGGGWSNCSLYLINNDGDAVEIADDYVGKELDDLQDKRIEYADFVVGAYNYEANKQSAWIQEIQVKVAANVSPLRSKRRVVSASDAPAVHQEEIDEEEIPFS